jgi:uncharacterized protein YkvS
LRKDEKLVEKNSSAGKPNLMDIIEFDRYGETIEGRIILLREEIVIVEILDNDLAKKFDLGNNRTVVKNGKYKIVEKSNLPQEPTPLDPQNHYSWKKRSV